MSDINFYDAAPAEEDSKTYDLLYKNFSSIGFNAYQLLEIAFRALMGSGVTKNVKGRGETLEFGGFYYDTLLNVAGRNLEEELRETKDLGKFITLANGITERVYKKTGEELGYTRIGIIKLENLDIAVGAYQEFLKSFNFNPTLRNSKPLLSAQAKKEIIKEYQKSLVNRLESSGRPLEGLITFEDDKMIINPNLFAYFRDYIIGSDIYWGYVLRKIQPAEKKLIRVPSFIHKKLVYEHLGNEFDSIKLNKTFFAKNLTADLIGRKIEDGRKSKLYQKRMDYFLGGPLGTKFIDQVLKLYSDKSNQELLKKLRTTNVGY